MSNIARTRRRCKSAPLGLALLVVGACSFAAACGGSSDTSSAAGIIHRLLIAAGGSGTGEIQSFPGRLPEDLPVKPPLYPGARLVVSSREPAPVGGQTPQPTTGNIPQPVLYLIVLDTDHDRSAVLAYYEKALEESPWQLEGSSSTEELDTVQFSDAKDADISGFVSIARGSADKATSILISLQDAGAFRQELPAYSPPASLRLPSRFPNDVAIYPKATITGTAYFRQPGNDDLLVTFVTTATQDEIMQFYRDAFQRNGWTVLAGAPLGLQDRLDFHDAKSDIQGSVLADRFSRDPRYTEVQIQVTVNPARTPASATPQATSSKAEVTPVPASPSGGPATSG